MEDLISTKDAAKILNVSQETLRQWRNRKLFGVPFFPADEKKNGAWYYYRERVEQLKELYNKGVLQDMYQLARLNEEKVCPFDICVTSHNTFDADEEDKKFYYEGEEVADILGVPLIKLTRWRKKNYFKPDFIGHEGTYYYSPDRVKRFAAAKNILIAPSTDIEEKEVLKNMTRKQKKKPDSRPKNIIFKNEYDAVQTQIVYTLINSDFSTLKTLINQWISEPMNDAEIDAIIATTNPICAFHNSMASRDVKLIDEKGNSQDFITGNADSFIGVPMTIEFTEFENFAAMFAKFTAPNKFYDVSKEIATLSSLWIGEYSHQKYFGKMRESEKPVDALLNFLSHFDLTFIDGDNSWTITNNRQKFVDVLFSAMSTFNAHQPAQLSLPTISSDDFNTLHLHAEKFSNGQADALPILILNLKKLLNIDSDESELATLLADSNSYHNFNRYLANFDFVILKDNQQYQILCTDETTYLEEMRIVQEIKAERKAQFQDTVDAVKHNKIYGETPQKVVGNEDNTGKGIYSNIVITTKNADSVKKKDEKVDENISVDVNSSHSPQKSDSGNPSKNDVALRLKRLSPNQLASIGVALLVEGKTDEIVCPYCGNGAGSSRTGLRPLDGVDFSKFHCFKCGQNFDNLDLFARHFNLDIKNDFKEILRRADDLSQDISVADAPPITAEKKELSQEELDLIASDIADAQSHIEDLPLEDRRGLSIDTLRHFGVGYLAKWIHPKNRIKGYRVPPDRRIIVPTSKRHYLAALLKADRPYVKEGHKKHAGNKEIFNADAITVDAINIIVEGEFDAMSIWQCGFKNVCAIGGVAEYKKFAQYLADKFPDKDSRLSLSILILFDNDNAGQLNSTELQKELFNLGIPSAIAFISDDKTDANDILIHEGRIELKARLEKIVVDVQDKILQARENISASNVDSENVDDSDISNDELERLKALPHSKDRNAQLIKAINDKLYLTPQRKRAHMKWVADSLQENADLIFSYDPVIDGLVGYDEFYRQYTFLKPVFWREGNCTGEQWKDADDKELRRYLRKTYQNFKGAELIEDSLIHYSRNNSFHPVKQYLESLKWDGVPRAETYFSKFLNVDDSAYTREITKKWMLGAISRIYHEGCDFQFALVLHGKQGIGKGYCLRMLGKKWHITLIDSLDDSHAIDALDRGWIVEIEELAAGRKAELNAQKAFLSANADTRRRAWGRHTTTTFRHCVFGITVNDEHFLRDLTGNRRYKILESRSKQNEIVEGLTDDYVDQVWAEVFQMYQDIFKDGFNDQLLRLSREVDAQAEAIANKHLQDDGLQGEVEAFLDKPVLPNFIWERLTKEERRKFTADGRIALEKDDIVIRINTQIKRPTACKNNLEKFNSYYEQNINNGTILSEQVRSNTGALIDIKTYFYGTVQRESTCAAEIFNECFGNDKRKSPIRINEILSRLRGWTRIGKHLKNFAGAYGDQKNIFYRFSDSSVY